jgi:hypothetical protein
MKNIFFMLALSGILLLLSQPAVAQTPCEEEVILVSPDHDFISTTFVEGATMLLTASNTIDNSTGEYRSENTILLEDGFKVYNTDSFLAQITDFCDLTATHNLIIAAGQAINYPNPFRTFTTIEFSLLQATEVRIELFDAAGRPCGLIQDNTQMMEGIHRIRFDAAARPNGLYFFKITAGSEISIGRMTLIR